MLTWSILLKYNPLCHPCARDYISIIICVHSVWYIILNIFYYTDVIFKQCTWSLFSCGLLFHSWSTYNLKFHSSIHSFSFAVHNLCCVFVCKKVIHPSVSICWLIYLLLTLSSCNHHDIMGLLFFSYSTIELGVGFYL